MVYYFCHCLCNVGPSEIFILDSRLAIFEEEIVVLAFCL